VDLGVVRSGGDQLSVRRSIAYFLDNINKQAERKETISAIGEDLFAIALDQPFRFPATFTFVLRAFSTLEGIGKSLNPEYNFATVAQPYAQELLDLQVSFKGTRGSGLGGKSLGLGGLVLMIGGLGPCAQELLNLQVSLRGEMVGFRIRCE
jgi:hypothetical protein